MSLPRNPLPPRFCGIVLADAFAFLPMYPGGGHPHQSGSPPAALAAVAKQEASDTVGGARRSAGSRKDQRPGRPARGWMDALGGDPNAQEEKRKRKKKKTPSTTA